MDNEKKQNGLERLIAIVKRLRAPNGCPWDRKQTIKTLKPCLLEETYELLQAMDEDDNLTLHREELGDVLLQVVMQSEIRDEQGKFNLNDVANNVSDKLVRRHPHVFGDVKVDNAEQVLKNWEAIKQKEKDKAPDRSALDGVPPALPALLKAQRVQQKASNVGFDWKDSSGAIEKIDEELRELKEAIAEGNQDHIEEEMGDLFFAAVNTCRFIHVDAESALSRTTQKFSRRFRGVEAAVRKQGKSMKDCSLEELDQIWDKIKQEEKDGASQK